MNVDSETGFLCHNGQSKYKAQMDDIIKISVDNIYQSREVDRKEIVGYQIIQTLLDKFITALIINIMEMRPITTL
jgi:dGTP triphosphohydrolase